MRKILLLAAVTALVVAVGTAAAKTVAVSITKDGFLPSSATLVQGDTVQFKNNDTVAHQITFKPTTGVTCAPAPLVLQPGITGTCTFRSTGNFSYEDPNTRGNTFRGSVRVAAAPASLSVSARPLLVTYGASAVLRGTLSTQAVGENIDVLAQACGAPSATKTATVKTTTGGAYTATVKPLQRTTYTTKSRALTSSVVAVRVRPRLRLARVAAHRYSLRVLASKSFAGKYASFQRYNGTLRRWVAVKSVRLKANSTGVAPTVVTSASFRSSVRGGLRVRTTLSQTAVGSCYAPGLSNTIRS
jgi:plastocyanin